jgi:hypothetical protein
MANNQKKLKAFVRYDGSGRVVASSLILRKNKPRVGRWFEIPEYLCCNGAPSSTTTTTTNGGGVTPTAFIKAFWSTVEAACSTTTEGTMVFYSSSPTLQAGIEIFRDAALTDRVPYGYVINPGDMSPNLEVSFVNGLLTNLVCPTTTTTTTQYVGQYYNADYASGPACAGTGAFSLPLIVDANACSNGSITLASGVYSDYGVNNGSTIYINLQNGSVIQAQVFGGSQMSFGCTAC